MIKFIVVRSNEIIADNVTFLLKFDKEFTGLDKDIGIFYKIVDYNITHYIRFNSIVRLKTYGNLFKGKKLSERMVYNHLKDFIKLYEYTEDVDIEGLEKQNNINVLFQVDLNPKKFIFPDNWIEDGILLYKTTFISENAEENMKILEKKLVDSGTKLIKLL